MSAINRQGKRPTPDDCGSGWSQSAANHPSSATEGRDTKRQRVRSSQAEQDYEPAHFLPGLWLVEKTWGLTKSLLGFAETAGPPAAAATSSNPPVVDSFSPDLPAGVRRLPEARSLQGPTMPAIEAAKLRMNQAFEAGLEEENVDREAAGQQEGPVIDLTGLSESPSPSPSPSSRTKPGPSTVDRQNGSSTTNTFNPSRSSNFIPTGIRVHQAFDHGLKQHTVGHRPRGRYSAAKIRQLVSKSVSTANPEPKFGLDRNAYQEILDAGPSSPTPISKRPELRDHASSLSSVRTSQKQVDGVAKQRKTSKADELTKKFADIGFNVAESSGSTSSLTSTRRSGMKKEVPIEKSSRRDLAALLGRIKAPPKKDPFDLKTLEAFLKQEREAEEKIQENLRRVALPKVAPVPTITDEMRKTIATALKNPRFISKCIREQVEMKDLRLLNPGQWLNDEVINFYMAMLQERADNDLIEVDGKKKKRRDIHCFNSFFYAKLGDDYAKSRIGRWTKKIDIFSKDIIVFPINKGNVHWLCGAINFKDKRFECYDSMNPNGHQEVYERLRRYVAAEHLDKKKTPIDLSDWVDYCDAKSPQQNNGWDCGVFSCQTLEHRARGLGDGDDASSGGAWEFKQADMKELRQLMIYEIGQAKLVPRGN